MDNNYKRYSPNRITSFPDILRSTIDSVRKTNIIVNRWITINNVTSSKIYDEDVRGLFIGHLKKDVFTDRHADFRRLSKALVISTLINSRCISNSYLDIRNNDYYRDKGFMEYFSESLKQIYYIKLSSEIIDSTSKEVEKIIDSYKSNELSIIDFDKLNQFKF